MSAAKEIHAALPDWLMPGTFFLDSDGDLCLYIGQGGWRQTDQQPLMLGDNPIANVPKIHFRPCEHLFNFSYKGEWHLSSFEQAAVDAPQAVQKIQPVPEGQLDRYLAGAACLKR